LVAPSANPEGLEPAKNISQARNYFSNQVDFYADSGKLESEPSTLIKISEDGKIEVLRVGQVKIK
jgi:L-threonylcarbamoyladenylate synthase